MTAPSWTTTAPIGTSSCASARSASAMARRMQGSSSAARGGAHHAHHAGRGASVRCVAGKLQAPYVVCRVGDRAPARLRMSASVPRRLLRSPCSPSRSAGLGVARGRGGGERPRGRRALRARHDGGRARPRGARGAGRRRRATSSAGRGSCAARAGARRDHRPPRRRRAVVSATPELRARIAAFSPNDTGVAAAGGTAGRLGRAAVGPRRPVRHQRRRRVGRRAAGRRPRAAARVRVAVVDTGVAYADRGRLRRSPDLGPSRLLRGHDFVSNDPYPNDENGHGTFVASTIAASANNGYGMVGVAYAADILPVRVLNADGGAGLGADRRGHPLRRQPRRAGHQRVDRALRPARVAAARPVDHELARDPRGDPLRAQPGRRRRRRRGEPRAGRRPLAAAGQRGHLRRRDDRARLPGRLLELRPGPRRRRPRRRLGRAAGQRRQLPDRPSRRAQHPRGHVPPLDARPGSSSRPTTAARRWPRPT